MYKMIYLQERQTKKLESRYKLFQFSVYFVQIRWVRWRLPVIGAFINEMFKIRSQIDNL